MTDYERPGDRTFATGPPAGWYDAWVACMACSAALPRGDGWVCPCCDESYCLPCSAALVQERGGLDEICVGCAEEEAEEHADLMSRNAYYPYPEL